MDYLCYFNGNIEPESQIKLHISDLAITRGFGAFDFMRTENGIPLFLDDYVRRFDNSCRELDLELPVSPEQLKEVVYDLVEKNGGGRLGIKFILTGGYAEDNYTPVSPNLIIVISELTFPPAELYERGVRLMTYNHLRNIATIKSLNYLMPISLRRKIKDSGADDILYFENGVISESARSNFFIIKNDTLITSDTGVLEGITRKRTIEVAKGILPVEIRPIKVEELNSVEEAFVTSTTKRILPVSKIDGYTLLSVGENWTKKLQEAFLEMEVKAIQEAINLT